MDRRPVGEADNSPQPGSRRAGSQRHGGSSPKNVKLRRAFENPSNFGRVWI